MRIVYLRDGKQVFGRDERERLLLAWLQDWAEGKPLRDIEAAGPIVYFNIAFDGL